MSNTPLYVPHRNRGAAGGGVISAVRAEATQRQKWKHDNIPVGVTRRRKPDLESQMELRTKIDWPLTLVVIQILLDLALKRVIYCHELAVNRRHPARTGVPKQKKCPIFRAVTQQRVGNSGNWFLYNCSICMQISLLLLLLLHFIENINTYIYTYKHTIHVLAKLQCNGMLQCRIMKTQELQFLQQRFINCIYWRPLYNHFRYVLGVVTGLEK